MLSARCNHAAISSNSLHSLFQELLLMQDKAVL